MDARRMRVSDSERERVVQFLREQSLEGRLDHDELDERMGAAYRAKTANELHDLIEDLPHRRVAPAPVHRPASRRRRQNGPHPLAIAGMCLLALLVLPTLAAGGVAVVFAVLAAVMIAVFVLGFLFGPFILIGMLISQAIKRRSRPPRHFTPNWH
jgi:Flp pilus assembly protein TadB